MIKNRILSSAGYGTHLVPLLKAALQTEHDVIEFGIGDYSTVVLHELFKYLKAVKEHEFFEFDRKLISYENDKVWADNYIDLQTDWHLINIIAFWDEVKIENPSIIFIDHAPAERRIIDIKKFREMAVMFVVHDTEKSNYYGYEPLLSSFKYKYVYERYSKQTTIVSDLINVKNL